MVVNWCFIFVGDKLKKSCKIFILQDFFSLSAERQGFEPREPLSSTVFKTAAIDHSATSPICMLSFYF